MAIRPSLAIQRSHERMATSARAREAGLLSRPGEVPLIRAQVVMAELVDGQ